MSSKIQSILGDEIAALHFNNPMDVIQKSKDGLTMDMLVRVGKLLALGQKDLAELVSISSRSLQRYRNDKKLNPIISENLLQIIDVIKMGYEVFDDHNVFLEWLNSPNKSLSQMKPVSLLKFRTGSALVRNLLGQIQHGIIS